MARLTAQLRLWRLLAAARLLRSSYARWDRHGRLVALTATAPPMEAPPTPGPDPAEPPSDDGSTPVPTDDVPVPPPPPAERTPADQQLPPPDNGVEFYMPICFIEGWETSDDRYFVPGGFGRRDLPMTLMAMMQNPDGGWGHDAAIAAGRIDTLERFDASAELNRETGEPFGEGVNGWRATGWLTPHPDQEGSQAAVDFIGNGTLRGVSADIGEAVSEIEVEAIDDEGWPTEFREVVSQGSIAGLTVCPCAAFPGATIELGHAPWLGGGDQAPPADGTPAETPPADQAPPADGATPPAATASAPAPVPVARRGQPGTVRLSSDADCGPCRTGRNLTASGGPEAPPRAWFHREEPDELTPWTVLASGECFGHLAPWNTCHTGVGNACVTAPRGGPDGYGLFHTGAVLSAEGEEVAVGHITLGGGHADVRLGIAPAVAHYDNAGAAVADVRATDGQHGIWLSGAVRPEADETQVRQLRAHALSGDWRADARGGPLRLVAALCVNVPGFPVPRARTASGAQTALVAAGAQAVEVIRRRNASGAPDAVVAAAVRRAMAPIVRRAAREELRRVTAPRR